MWQFGIYFIFSVLTVISFVNVSGLFNLIEQSENISCGEADAQEVFQSCPVLFNAVKLNKTGEVDIYFQVFPSASVCTKYWDRYFRWSYTEYTPLSFAAQQDYLRVAATLIEHGANINRIKAGEHIETALAKASGRGHLKMVNLLLTNGANPNLSDSRGGTPLRKASAFGHTDVVRALLKHGANVNVRDKEGKTPLIWAVFFRQYFVIKELLQGGADVNLKDNRGESALMGAVRMNYMVIVGVLCDGGAALDDADYAGKTALIYAAGVGRLSLVKYFCRRNSGDVGLRDGYEVP